MLTWTVGKCTLVIAEETGEGLKLVRAVKKSVNLCFSNTCGLLKKVRASALLALRDLEWGYLDNTNHFIF